MNYNVTWNGGNVRTLTTDILEPCYNAPSDQEFVIIPSNEGGILTVKSEKPVSSVIVRPLSLGLEPVLSDEHTITLELDKPAKFSLEINGSYQQNLLVFISPDNTPEDLSSFEHIIRFAPGEHKVDSFKIEEDNTLVIVEEGAVVNGMLCIYGRNNVTVCGHGIITKEKYDYDNFGNYFYLLHADNSTNINIYDVTFQNSVRWTVAPFHCKNVHIDNINIIGSRGNNDGIDICNSQDVLVEHVFTRTWDDSFVVKGITDKMNVENVEFRDSTLWNDFARPMEIGVEMRCDYAKDIRFKNIDVIHSMTGYPIMGIHHGDHANVSGILIDDIRLEDIHGGQIFDLRITNSVWNKDDRKGSISDVTIKNIAIVEEQPIIPSRSRVEGYDENTTIEDVTLENFSFCGRFAKTIDECQVDVYDFAKNVIYECEEEENILNEISSKLDFVKKPEYDEEDGLYHSTVRIKLKNNGDSTESGDVRLAISPVNTAEYDIEPRFFALKPGESVHYNFDVALQPGRYAFALQSTSPCVEYVFRFVELEAVISDSLETSTSYSFHNFYGEEVSGIRFAVKDNNLLIKAPFDEPLTVFAALPVERDDNEVLFTVEETDFGIAPAINNSPDGPVPAPQLRCPAEITYVFLNQPKVKEIVQYNVTRHTDLISIPLEALHIPEDAEEFLLEVEIHTAQNAGRRYPFTLFHSVKPADMAHMFCKFTRK